MAPRVKNLPAMQETWVRFLGREDPLEKVMANPTDRGNWRATICEVTNIRTRLNDYS